MTATVSSRVLVLGADRVDRGGHCGDLARRGFPVIAAARRFTPAQRNRFGANARELPSPASTRTRWRGCCKRCDVVVNCLGVLQDAPATARANSRPFVGRLSPRCAPRGARFCSSICRFRAPRRTTVPPSAAASARRSAPSPDPASLRDPAAGLRVGAGAPMAAVRCCVRWRRRRSTLPASLAGRPFAVVAVEDIADTVAVLAQRWQQPDRSGPRDGS